VRGVTVFTRLERVIFPLIRFISQPRLMLSLIFYEIRQSVAATRQETIAPAVWIGSEQINVAQLMLDSVALMQ
jgi:hypothetical protein